MINAFTEFLKSIKSIKHENGVVSAMSMSHHDYDSSEHDMRFDLIRNSESVPS